MTTSSSELPLAEWVASHAGDSIWQPLVLTDGGNVSGDRRHRWWIRGHFTTRGYAIAVSDLRRVWVRGVRSGEAIAAEARENAPNLEWSPEQVRLLAVFLGLEKPAEGEDQGSDQVSRTLVFRNDGDGGEGDDATLDLTLEANIGFVQLPWTFTCTLVTDYRGEHEYASSEFLRDSLFLPLLATVRHLGDFANDLVAQAKARDNVIGTLATMASYDPPGYEPFDAETQIQALAQTRPSPSADIESHLFSGDARTAFAMALDQTRATLFPSLETSPLSTPIDETPASKASPDDPSFAPETPTGQSYAHDEFDLALSPSVASPVVSSPAKTPAKLPTSKRKRGDIDDDGDTAAELRKRELLDDQLRLKKERAKKRKKRKKTLL